jgi:uncharacterized membrane protein YiaA
MPDSKSLGLVGLLTMAVWLVFYAYDMTLDGASTVVVAIAVAVCVFGVRAIRRNRRPRSESRRRRKRR